MVLISMDGGDLCDIGINIILVEQVEWLVKLIWDCGLDGVVCFVYEVVCLKQVCGEDFKLVILGICFEGSDVGDQCCIMILE